MQLERVYRGVYFDGKTVRAAIEAFAQMNGCNIDQLEVVSLITQHGRDTWHYSSVEEFLAAYRSNPEYASCQLTVGFKTTIHVSYHRFATMCAVTADDRERIMRVIGVFDDAEGTAQYLQEPEPEVAEEVHPTIFIGHGRSQQWRDLKDHLQDKHGYQVEAYETGARAGHEVRDVLTEMMTKSSFAVLVLTGEDETATGEVRARQNVVHEAGLFQGKLGFSRAILLVEEGVETFTNIDGIHQIRFREGRIQETFGEVLATIRREFGDAR